ncbi:MAG: hypothetical protein K1X89_23050, partial [Myxococcaceae bacterium]|nr:hypothetical protein [Myxococcaceae bacterium]
GAAGGGAAGGGAAGGGDGGGAAGGGAGGGHGGGAGGGSASAYCKSCADSTQCGGANNFCLGFSFGNYCGTDCSAGQTCGANARCVSITDGNGTTIGKNCVPLSGQTCGGSGGGGGAGGGGGSSGGGAGGSGGGAGGCGVDTWANYAQSFFNTNCNSCHTHTGEFTSQSYVRSIKTSITSRINVGNMPQGRTLSTAERTRIISYMNCNAP